MEINQVLRVENNDGTFCISCLLVDKTLDIWDNTTAFEIFSKEGETYFYADNTAWLLHLHRLFKHKNELVKSMPDEDIENFYTSAKRCGKDKKEARKEFVKLVKRAKLLGMI